MAKKDFSKINPTEKFFGTIESGEILSNEKQETQIKKTSITPKNKKTNSDYLRLDIYDYKDYLTTMAGFKRTSVTKYIQSLINADIQQNKEIYEKLKNI